MDIPFFRKTKFDPSVSTDEIEEDDQSSSDSKDSPSGSAIRSDA